MSTESANGRAQLNTRHTTDRHAHTQEVWQPGGSLNTSIPTQSHRASEFTSHRRASIEASIGVRTPIQTCDTVNTTHRHVSWIPLDFNAPFHVQKVHRIFHINLKFALNGSDDIFIKKKTPKIRVWVLRRFLFFFFFFQFKTVTKKLTKFSLRVCTPNALQLQYGTPPSSARLRTRPFNSKIAKSLRFRFQD